MRTLAAAVVMVPLVALGGWRATTFNGTGRDIHVIDAGTVIVISDAEAVLKDCPLDSGACGDAAAITSTTLVGASVNDGGCLWGVNQDGTLTQCGYTGSTVSAARRLRCFGNGGCAVVGQNMTNNNQLFTAVVPGSGPVWRPAGAAGGTAWQAPLTNAVTGVMLDGVDYLLLVSNSPGFTLVIDGGANLGGAPLPGTAQASTDGVLFLRPDGHLGMLAVLRDAQPQRERYGADVTFNGVSVDAGWLPDPIAFDSAIGGLRLVSYSELGGSSAGYGFGMGTQRDGGFQLASPVPNPAAPGMLWVPRGTVGQLPAPQALRALSCIDPRFCVALPLTGSIAYVYWNEGGATGTIQGPGTIREGTSVSVSLVPNDVDGDPSWVTWLSDGGVLQISPDLDGGTPQSFATVVAGPNPGGACVQMLPVSALVSDGWAPHDTVIDGGLLYHRTTPDPAMLTPLMDRTEAGGLPITLTAVASGCAGELTWTLLGDAGTLSPGAGSAIFTPPSHFCVADGGVVVTVSGQLDGGAPVAGSSATIAITPWGAPNAPQLGATMFKQDAGTMEFYGFVGPRHVCEQANGFPGVSVRLLDAGAPPMVTVMAGTMGVTVNSTDPCSSGTVSPQLVFELNGATSPPSTFDIELVADTGPLVSPPPFSIGLVPGVPPSGTFTVGAQCLAQRGLQAEVLISGPVSGTSGRVAAPGPWVVPLGVGACNGGTFVATGTLYQDGGFLASDQVTFDAGALPAAVGELDPKVLPITCEGLDSLVGVGQPGCPFSATTVTWTQDAGPAVSLTPEDGGMRLRSLTAGLEGLIGETLTFDIESNAGLGNVGRATRRVQLDPGRFVTVAHRVSPIVADRDDVVTVTATVTNTATCGVSGVMLVEMPSGLRFIDGSARVDGVSVAASGAPSIGPFELEGGQTRVVTWHAKVPLLGTPRARGTAFIAGQQVSEPEEEPIVPGGCGCGAAPGALFGLALLALLRRGSRRR